MIESNNAIMANELHKTYGSTVAVDRATLSVKKGEIFGFLGLNGAGKSTTIKMLATLIQHSSGSAQVLGFDISKEGLEIRRRIGVVQQRESYDRNLTVKASLRLYASLWGIPKAIVSEKVESLAQKFELREVMDRKIRWLSFGRRRRLQVAREFLHDAAILFLDEPTVGMDVLARHAFLDLCREKAKKDGQTIFYTTHIISEAEYLCDRLAVIHHGRIIAIDSPRELKRNYAGVKTISIVLKNSADLQNVVRIVDSMSNVKKTEISSSASEVNLVSQDPFKLAYELSLKLGELQIEAESISVSEAPLEEVIVRLIGDSK